MPSNTSTSEDYIRIDCTKPFAFWSLPGSCNWEGITQENDPNKNSNSNELEGFLVASFNNQTGARLIQSDRKISQEDNFELIIDQRSKEIESEGPNETSKEEYIAQCTSLIEMIRQGKSAKVVLSRVKKEEYYENPKSLFLRLVDEYKDAMVFMYSFGKELWIGASPETLLKYENGKFMTMALAGSKSVKENKEWTNKEVLEQAYVEDYIEEILKKNNISYIKDGPKDINAGPVKHLLSEFKGELNKKDFLKLLNELHPTPAVCGIPLSKASKIIEEIELHKRGDYTGYIGPIYSDKAHMFVNLRSAMLLNKEIFLYLGGGITAGSVPEEEWKETELKADTLLRIL